MDAPQFDLDLAAIDRLNAPTRDVAAHWISDSS
jgi:hypothetical protein